MKLCFICCEYPPGPHGGIGTFYQYLANSFVDRGHDVHVLGVYPPSYPSPPFEVAEGVQVIRIKESPIRFVGWLWNRYKLYRQVRALIKQDKIDLIEVPDYEGWCAGWPSMAVPRIVRTHGSGTQTHTDTKRAVSTLIRVLERDSIRRASHWIAISNFIAARTQEVFALPRGPSAILYNSVELPSLTDPRTRSRVRVIFSGTLNENKGIRRLAQAWPTVRKGCPQAELHVYGKDGRTACGGSMKRSIEELLGSTRSAGVFFHGHVQRSDLLEALNHARLAVYPSYTEAFALAPMESMARGCPTVYTTRASGPELIAHGVDGFLVDPDQPEEIARTIISLLRNDDVAYTVGIRGRRKIEHSFSPEVIVAKNEEFYLNCLNGFGNS